MHSALESTRSVGSAQAISESDYPRAFQAGVEQAQKSAAPGVPGAIPGALPDVGIVVLNYNTRDLLRDCLASLLRPGGHTQTDAPRHACDFLVCVVDNASTDGSADMVRVEFPEVYLIENKANVGYSAGNNVGLRWFGFGTQPATDSSAGDLPRDTMPRDDLPGSSHSNHRNHPNQSAAATPRYALLLNPDTVVPPGALDAMLAYLDAHPAIGVAGPRVRRPDGSLDLACRRSFPTPMVSAYRMAGLSRLFPKSRRFNAYNLAYLPEDAIHPVDSVVGAFMLVRAQAIAQAGLLDERFFMYGEDLDWAKRIKDAGWQIWYNGQVEIVHVKEAASRQSSKARIDFYEAMWLFYQKHYRATTPRGLEMLILLGIVAAGSLDIARHLWRFGRTGRHFGQRGTPANARVEGRA